MNIFITFDYELFFGSSTGTVDRSILLPTQQLMQIAEKHQVKFTFFVDVLYLMQLELNSSNLQHHLDLNKIKTQLRKLIIAGHDVQLHLHTHWVNAIHQDKWIIDYENYRIHNFDENQIDEIVRTSTLFLENITLQKVFAFRAGGWCLQPFQRLRKAFHKNGIWLDSTVFHKGYNDSPTNLFDFRQAPDQDIWNFSEDPLQIVEDGFFTELPISSIPVSPIFYWKLAVVKKMFSRNHRSAGDGIGIPNPKAQLLRLLLKPTYTAVSCDGYKASLLEPAFREHTITGKSNFVIIGHPKLMTPYSFSKLDKFLSNCITEGHNVTSIQESFGGQNLEKQKLKLETNIV